MVTWLYWILTFLFFLVAFLMLHRPLPTDISDRKKLTFFEIILRISNEYVGDLIEKIYGAETRNRFARMLLVSPYLLSGDSAPPHIERRKVKIAGVSCITYKNKNQTNDSLLVFIHGGGWAIGHGKLYDARIYSLTKKIGNSAVSINYRLAPEHPFPAGLDDCETVLKQLATEGLDNISYDKKRLLVMGDSAGGNLTASVCQRFDRAGLGNIAAQILIYPVIHVFNFSSPSYQDYSKKYSGTALLNPKHMARFILLYLGIPATQTNMEKLQNSQHLEDSLENSAEFTKLIGQDFLPEPFRHGHERYRKGEIDPKLAAQFSDLGTNPDISPIFGVTSTLPPALVITAGYDILRDEGWQYFNTLQAKGVKAIWKHYPTAFHGIFNVPRSDDKEDMVNRIVEFCQNY